MIIPSKVKIGSHTYTILRESSMRGSGIGSCSPWELTIRVIDDNGAKESRIAEALLHEIIEAIDSHYNLNLPHDKLTVLGELLFGVLRDNHDLNFQADTKVSHPLGEPFIQETSDHG